MFGIIGIVVTFAMVFGGYILAGGKMGVITHSLPFEMMMIGGAAVGSYLLTNDSHTLKHTPKRIVQAFKGAKWTEADHQDIDLVGPRLNIGRVDGVRNVERAHCCSCFT